MRRNDREVKSQEEIRSIIKSSDVCRVAFADNNTPYIVTMNFGFVDGGIPLLYFHCAPEGRKIEIIRKNNYVCFEMDTDHVIYSGEKGCDWGMKFRSVIGYGRIFIAEGEAERIKGLNAVMEHYGGKGPFTYAGSVMKRTTVLRLEIEEMTGKSKQ